MSAEIPESLRRVDRPTRGGHVIVRSLPWYVVALHIAETKGIGGACHIIGSPGDRYGDEGLQVPEDKVRVELVLPRITPDRTMSLDSFLSDVDAQIGDLERGLSGRSLPDRYIPESLVIAYRAAKQPKRSSK